MRKEWLCQVCGKRVLYGRQTCGRGTPCLAIFRSRIGKGEHRAADPTPKEIREQCEKYQEDWTDAERHERLGRPDTRIDMTGGRIPWEGPLDGFPAPLPGEWDRMECTAEEGEE